MTEPLIVRRNGPVVTLTLNQPEKHHALDVPAMYRLAGVVEELSGDRDVRVVVVTATGEKTFCAGADLSNVDDDYPWQDDPLTRITDRLEDIPALTVCALNGSVFGGGTDVALACDFRIGKKGQRTFIPPARFGIHYQTSGMRRAVERIGLNAAKRLYLAGETFSSDEMLRVGFVDHLLDPADYQEFVDAYVQELASMAPLAVRGMKYVLNGVARGELDRQRVLDNVRACVESDDFREGQRAIAEKRKPVFNQDAG